MCGEKGDLYEKKGDVYLYGKGGICGKKSDVVMETTGYTMYYGKKGARDVINDKKMQYKRKKANKTDEEKGRIRAKTKNI